MSGKVEPEGISDSLMHSVVNDYTSSALVELSETVLDTATESILKSDALTKIPVLGTLVGFTKGVLVFRDRRYASKILSFLAETAKASEEDKRKYREKLDKNPEECAKAGEVVLDIIDKITSAEKAIMIGKVFRAYMHEDNLTTEQLIYLCEIIERTYLQDLVSLQKSEVHNESNLESVGIRKPMRVEDINKAILEAVNQAVEEATSRAGVIKEAFTAEQIAASEKKALAQVEKSGLTDEGHNLMRILRSY